MQHPAKSAQLGQAQQLVQVAGEIVLLGTAAGDDACNQRRFFGERLDVAGFVERVRFIHIAFDKNRFFDACVFCGGKIIVQ